MKARSCSKDKTVEHLPLMGFVHLIKPLLHPLKSISRAREFDGKNVNERHTGGSAFSRLKYVNSRRNRFKSNECAPLENELNMVAIKCARSWSGLKILS